MIGTLLGLGRGMLPTGFRLVALAGLISLTLSGHAQAATPVEMVTQYQSGSDFYRCAAGGMLGVQTVTFPAPGSYTLSIDTDFYFGDHSNALNIDLAGSRILDVYDQVGHANHTVSGTISAGGPQSLSLFICATGVVPNGVNWYNFSLLYTPDVPTATSLSPYAGPLSGGTSVTLTGTGFGPGDASVTFDGTIIPAASVVVNSPTSLTFTAPAHSAGNAAVSVTTSGGTSTTVPGGFTVMEVPTASSLSPAIGSTSGGTMVTISGTDFVAGLTTVNLNGITIPTGSVTVNSATSLTFNAPAHPAGNVTVKVVTPGGDSATVPGGFTYAGVPAVTGLSPAAGPVAGNSIVTITGSGFTLASSVHFGSTLAAGFTINSDTSITATSPAGTGTVDVVVTTPLGVSVATPAAQFVYVAAGTIAIKQVTRGGDGTFGFTSATPGLNFTLTTSGGVGETAPISLPPGNYVLAATQNAGFGLSGISCSTGGTGDVGSASASITLAAGEAVVCTFTSFNSQSATTQLIESFAKVQGRILLGNLPNAARRFDRLEGVVSAPNVSPSAMMGYFAQAGTGTLQMPVISTSLAQINAIADQPRSAFDAWFQATLGSYASDGLSGNFGVVSVGADYLVSKDLLVGGFLQADMAPDGRDSAGGSISSTGWLAGPYATIRLDDGLYLDLLAGAGRAANRISPNGTYTDGFDANRWLASASLTGQWEIGDLTISPTASLGYFQSTSDAYVDGLGVGIPRVTGGVGQAAFGPNISYRFALGDGLMAKAMLGFDGVLELPHGDTETIANLHARAKAGIGLTTLGGASLSLSGGLDGLGGGTRIQSLSGSLNLSIPTN